MMANYDGHTAKRQRTDGEGRDRGFGGQQQQQFYYRGGRPHEEEKPNHILLITVINPAYPITVEVIHTICNPSGKVLRIVIFKKNGVQAMVEFDSIESATRAKESLNGADIYSGCCTLKIEFAKPSKLNVYKNDNDSWDYTNPQLGKTNNPTNDRPALLQEPRNFGGGGGFNNEQIPMQHNQYQTGPGGDGGHAPQAGGGYDRGDPYDNFNNPAGSQRGRPGYDHYGPPQDRYGGPPQDRYNSRDCYDEMSSGGMGGHYQGGMQGGQGAMQGQGAVMMVYGLCAKQINCDKLFNLLCLYGNVIRIKFLKSKDGCAMVQMGDALAVERCISNLNNAMFFESKIQLKHSKQAFLNDVPQPFELPDGSPSFRDYMGNRNNRFNNPDAATKNRILAPSKTLHFFNTPFGIKENDVVKIFEDHQAKLPTSVKLFPSKTERSSSGLLEYESISDALESLIHCNHIPISNPSGKFPFILKLCFSSTGPRF